MAISVKWKRAGSAAAFCTMVLAWSVTPSISVYAQDKGQVFATEEGGFARLILSFPELYDLPKYTMRMENSVLSVAFDKPVALLVPDIAASLPSYISTVRLDPDGRGIRFALRDGKINFNPMPAGDRLFIDLMPNGWQGMPPNLPLEVIDELAVRAKAAAVLSDQERKASDAERLKPVASVRVGMNPTFMRVQFDWSVDTGGEFELKDGLGTLAFEWPVDIDIADLLGQLPPQILAATSTVTPDGARVALNFADGVKPRFYRNSPRQFMLDIDLGVEAGTQSVQQLAQAFEENRAKDEAVAAAAKAAEQPKVLHAEVFAAAQVGEAITPIVSAMGATVRIAFAFGEETPAAVFKRGHSVWMIFDTTAPIKGVGENAVLAAANARFTVTSEGESQIVRIELADDRLASLATEGNGWVLSLGDHLLAPTEPVGLERRQDRLGLFEMTAALEHPGRVHQLRDPDAGDVLEVVTAYPPARGVTRNLDFVDFSTIRSVHGLVVRPQASDVRVAIDNKVAVISAPDGLTISAVDGQRGTDLAKLVPETPRTAIDLNRLWEQSPERFGERSRHLIVNAAEAGDSERDRLRLDLAELYVANRFALEAIGVLNIFNGATIPEGLRAEAEMTLAIARVVAGRTAEALTVLNASRFGSDADALVWRTMARADTYDYAGARHDALAAAAVIADYPVWVRTHFALATARAGVETGDTKLALSALLGLNVGGLDLAEASVYRLLNARIDEVDGRLDLALDGYGKVIAAEDRPMRAEAVYRTLLMLDKKGELDIDKAVVTLAGEAMMWRGNALEADMQKLLAELYFRRGDYRLGLETAKQTVQYYPENPSINALRDDAQTVFSELYLDGMADTLSPVDALSLYYDFRQLTPAGSRGDEMIRNLARRLVGVDLLPQAAVLLQYQIDSRLSGVAKVQVAADLAAIYLADRQPELAMRVLSATRSSDLSPTLVRQRRVLEARAMIDSGREELAIDLLRTVEGNDADLLRVDAHWKAGRYTAAGELLEVLYSPRVLHAPMSEAARNGIVRAAVGFVLANDRMALNRLRVKFEDDMAQGPQWPLFDFVTNAVSSNSLEFKAVARDVAGLDSLKGFLATYRELYGNDDALVPAGKDGTAPGPVASR